FYRRSALFYVPTSVRAAAPSSAPHASPAHLFFFNDTATTEIYTLSLHDALPISRVHVNSFAAMPKIVRRPLTDGADRWPWPAGMHRVLKQVLARRPLRSIDELVLSLSAMTPVGRFEALGAAVELLLAHRTHGIVIVGDFDADGATSAALATLTLRRLGFPDVHYFIPDRFELGYGLTPEVVDRVDALAPRLIMTVDNGITSHAGVEAARARGIDVLITDHHLPPDVVPPANVIVNPNLPGDPFSEKHLAGVGVVFYLLAALGKALGRPNAVLEFI